MTIILLFAITEAVYGIPGLIIICHGIWTYIDWKRSQPYFISTVGKLVCFASGGCCAEDAQYFSSKKPRSLPVVEFWANQEKVVFRTGVPDYPYLTEKDIGKEVKIRYIERRFSDYKVYIDDTYSLNRAEELHRSRMIKSIGIGLFSIIIPIIFWIYMAMTINP
ncbi:MAG: hypothetical protein ACOYIF_03585 [Acetivibrionales bacterium]|jgi:hypothetical protein